MDERSIVFPCQGADLVGIVHDPSRRARRGVVVVVGGPQYRAGSHRSFVLLARALAAAGTPVFRFDYRGLGDSGGTYLGFEHLHDDIAAAIDAFMAEVPSLDGVVLWGLCDAASAALSYAPTDPRVTGLVLANPWVRTDATLARATLRHYYAARLMQRAFWVKLLGGRLNPLAVVRSFRQVVVQATANKGSPMAGKAAFSLPATAASPLPASDSVMPAAAPDAIPLPDRMAEALRRYSGRVLLLMSGRDLTAREFDDVSKGSRAWRRAMARQNLTRVDLPASDHTFSRQVWRDTVADVTVEWLGSWSEGPVTAGREAGER